MSLPSFADIEAAARRIAPHAIRTPLIESAPLGALTGARVFVKPETLQRNGSFKFRGACNRVARMGEAERARGVVAFSSGNHAQGVAAAAGLFGARAVIVMPKDAPRTKIEGTRALGAEIVFYDRLRDDREAIAMRLCEERGATLVRPFDDADIVAGQGTVGLEIAQDMAQLGVALEAVLVPCGGGGLVAGIALALSCASPEAAVVSVEPEGFDGMRRSLAQGAPIAAPGGAASLADALMAPKPGDIPFAVARHLLREGIAVNDEELCVAVRFAVEKLKLTVEPGGAAALAALTSGKFQGAGGALVVVLSGANSDFATIAECLARAGAA